MHAGGRYGKDGAEGDMSEFVDLRKYIANSARHICQNVRGDADEACPACLWNARNAIAAFVDAMPDAIRKLPKKQLIAALCDAGETRH